MPRLVTNETLTPIMRELGAMGILAVQVQWPDRRLPDHEMYRPYTRGWATYAPWAGERRITAVREQLRGLGKTMLVDGDRAWTLISAFKQTQTLAGEIWETGTYQGGSAMLLKLLIQEAARESGQAPVWLRLFDSFEGMPATDKPLDLHGRGDFGDTGLEEVKAAVGAEPWIDFRKGWIPATFAGLESSAIRLAHIDVDLHQSVLDSCEFIYPRMAPGGVMVFDDYGLASCPGARAAVDQFFRGRAEAPFALINGQCIVTRL
ncbi:MAG: TylF/MycF/NovP-related O-methyltransferase [Terriglobales bacterium]